MLSKGYMSIRLFYLEVFAQLFREINIPGSTASRKTILRRIIDRSITIIAVISSITPKDFPLHETENTQISEFNSLHTRVHDGKSQLS